ncbi:MAG: YbaN family protein [Chloroflexi bacterium]|nr:YbaN family protein [Chloroflexota bacterium]MDE2703006.1 YbaN family protein [Chloroflexota bacterium]MDE2863312.1 YbaN family protein [Chloroflexota bacterium]
MRQQLGERARRYLLMAFGVLCLSLGAIGLVVPGLPTTIFVILAAWAFVRSCPVLHRWLLENRLFGPRLQAWYDDPTLPRAGKLAIIAAIAISITISITLARPPAPLTLAGLAVAGFGAWWVWFRIPTRAGTSSGGDF